MFKLLLLVLSTLFISAYAVSDIHLSTALLDVDYEKDTPFFTFTYNSTDSYYVDFLSITEYNGKDLAKDPVSLKRSGVWVKANQTEVDYVALFEVEKQNVTLLISTYVYENKTKIEDLGNSSLTMPSNSLKFTIIVQDWPFQKVNDSVQTDNTLHFDINFSAATGNFSKSHGKKGQITSLFVGEESNKTDSLLWISFPQKAVYVDDKHDQDYSSIGCNLTEEALSSATITLVFDYFEKGVVYDPTLSFVTSTDHTDSTSGTGKMILLIVVACVAGAIVAIVVAVIVVLFLRRKRSHYEEV